MDKIRLVIVSEDLYSLKGLTAIFNTEDVFEVLGGFSLGEALENAISYQPDVVLVDIPDDMMTDYGDKIVEIKGGCPCSLILAVVGEEYRKTLEEVLRNGLDGCVPRGIMRGCLVRTVELACRSGLLCLPRSFKKGDNSSKHTSSSSSPFCRTAIPGQVETLTRREVEILQLMSENLSNRKIGERLFISEPTVKTHVSNILRKLGQSNRAQAIVYSYKMGLVTGNELVVK